MPPNDLLSEFSKSDILAFRKDLIQLMHSARETDIYYGEVNSDTDTIAKKFLQLAETFNKKYRGIKIKCEKKVESFDSRIFLKERNIKDFFANCASKIGGLRAVGRSNFNQVDVDDSERFAQFLESLMDKVFLTYVDPESGTSTIAAEHNIKEKMVELLYEFDDLINENSAGFRMCAYYALKNGSNKKVNFYEEAITLGFSRLPKW